MFSVSNCDPGTYDDIEVSGFNSPYLGSIAVGIVHTGIVTLIQPLKDVRKEGWKGKKEGR